jgi:ABC-type transport system involved in cytochrome c biogenesis permease component
MNRNKTTVLNRDLKNYKKRIKMLEIMFNLKIITFFAMCFGSAVVADSLQSVSSYAVAVLWCIAMITLAWNIKRHCELIDKGIFIKRV